VSRITAAVWVAGLVIMAVLAGSPTTGFAGADTSWMPPPSTAELVALENLRLLDQRVRLKSRASPPNLWNVGIYKGMRDGKIQLLTNRGTTLSVAKADLKDFQVSSGTRNNAGAGAMVGGSLGFFAGYVQASDTKHPATICFPANSRRPASGLSPAS